jgi:16S rRNA processing protein RimM
VRELRDYKGLFEMIRKEELVKIGQFAKPHGVKGEISLITSYDLFEKEDDPFIVCEIEGIYVPFFVEDYRYKSATVVLLKLENLDSEEAIRSFVNREVFVLKDRISQESIAAGITWDNFVGYTIYDTNGDYKGIVEAVDDSTMNVLFRIMFDGNPYLIPVAEELIESLDQDNKKRVLSVPQGLFEL